MNYMRGQTHSVCVHSQITAHAAQAKVRWANAIQDLLLCPEWQQHPVQSIMGYNR